MFTAPFNLAMNTMLINYLISFSTQGHKTQIPSVVLMISLEVFNPIQFAFLEGKSTLTQLLTCYNDWASSRNKPTPTDVVFLDFSKASLI